MDSILISIKTMLGLDEDYDAFDTDVIVHINSAIMVLTQLGIGPEEGFTVTSKDDAWDEFIGESTNLEAVKTYIYLKVRIVFDPPTSSFVMESMLNQIKEYEWRLNVQAEGGEESQNE
jgi:hypothetical protein